MTRRLLYIALASLLWLASTNSYAQFDIGADESASSTEVSENESEAMQDPLGRSTPQGAFSGYIGAIAEENYVKAAKYLELSDLPSGEREAAGAQLAKDLRLALDSGGSVKPTSALSDSTEGHLEDGLAPTMEQIGTISLSGEVVPLLLEQTQDEPIVIWRISSQTLALLPNELQDVKLTVNQLLPPALVQNKWNGVPLGHWIAMILIAVGAYFISRLVTSTILTIARTVISRKYPGYPSGLVEAFSTPMQLYAAVLLFVAAAEQLGISIVLRQYFSELVVIIASLALLLLVWRLVDVAAGVAEKKMVKRARFGALSAILFFRRSVKVVLITFGIIAILDLLGFDVTTGLAALGIGGIAIALGAQKTVENLVGSLTLIFDQPVRVGDFCKVGDIVGTVEQIGMRSTRIRTLARTVVVIPNGDFSAQKIENYFHRDKFLLRALLGVRYETSPDQMRYLLAQIKSELLDHPRVDPDPARVRFVGYGSSSLDIEIFAYVHAEDYNNFLEIQEEINLKVADVVEASGTGFAFPSRTLYMARDSGLSEEKSLAAEDQVKQWRARDDQSIPRGADGP